MNKIFKSNKGITLIVLVITIIILIILAAISISLLMGENGLITKAKQGAQNYQNSALEEQQMLNNFYGDFATEIAKTEGTSNPTTPENTGTSGETNGGSTTGTTGGGLTEEEHNWLESIYQNQIRVATLVGSYTGDQTIDVTVYLKEGDTVDNFIIEPKSVTVSANNNKACNDTNNRVNRTFTFSKTLSGNSLVISGTGGSTTVSGNPYVWGSSTLTYNIYHI